MNTLHWAKSPFWPVMLCALILGVLPAAGQAETNGLSAAEVKAGWRLLFDGASLKGWRTYAEGGRIGAGWQVENGLLHKLPNVPGGDIMTVDTFTDFEFAWEWKLAAKGNSGVKYFITPERKSAVGHEYQMIDDTLVPDPLGSTASFYLVVAPRPDKPLKPMGEWNQSRIVVRGDRVEHWLNGALVVSYTCGDPAILAQVARTKFSKVAGFGGKVTGHLLLTDHKDECWFRQLRVRELK